MSRTIEFPRVAHMVADLDDLDDLAPRSLGRSLMGRFASSLRRLVAYRRLASSANNPVLAMLLAFILACSDSNDPVTSVRAVARVGVTPTTVVLEEGATRQLTVVAFDADDNVLSGRTVGWSTDASAIATVSATGLVTAVADGYAVIRATVEGKSASSGVTVLEPEPAEQFELMYERRPFNGGGDIRRLSLTNGTTVTLPLLATIPGSLIRNVTPSPDGLRVAFTVAWYPDGEPLMDGDIYVANIDGTGVQRLTNTPELDDQPAWSPDGTRIAYRSRRSGDWDIWVMGANGTGQVNLMTNVLPATSNDQTPSWSPDGLRIVYSSDLDHFAYSKLWTMRPDGTNKRRLLPLTVGNTDVDLDPSWSPDGTHVAFRRIGGGDGADIVIATVATGAVTRIQLEGMQAFPSWAPDGSRIAFSSAHDGLLAHIFTMNADGSEVVKHTTGSDENTYPRWLRAR